jgi:hypothetical protein
MEEMRKEMESLLDDMKNIEQELFEKNNEVIALSGKKGKKK